MSGNDWDILIPNVAFAYDNTPNRMIVHNPYDIIHGNGTIRPPFESSLSRSVHDIDDKIVERRRNTIAHSAIPDWNSSLTIGIIRAQWEISKNSSSILYNNTYQS